MKKDKIYTITCTWAPSYGAVLQAYALASKLNSLDYETKILNYQPAYARPGMSGGLLKPVYSLKDYIFNSAYMNFLRDSSLLTEESYTSNDDLVAAGISAGAFVVGSDQVWNCTKYYNGKDDAMFLDFAHPTQKRISYAASLAMSEVPARQANRYRRLLKKFDAISVREKSGTQALEKIGVTAPKTVIDPVYLLNKKEWGKLADKGSLNFSKDKYMLVICLEERDSVYEYARRKADLLGVKLYTFKGGLRSVRAHQSVDKSFRGLSVYDYLDIIRGAEAVVTDSFHGMSFSIIFNRNVDIIPRQDGGNSRMIDLLDDLGLSGRIVKSEEVLMDNIDFTSVDTLIEQKVGDAQLFLKESLDK